MKIISVLRCNLKRIILLLSVFHHKVHLITLVFYGFQLDIEQWGQVKNNAASQKVNYPIAFSYACYAIVFGIVYNNLQYSYDQVTSYDKIGFYTYQNIDDPLTIRYVALGKQKQWGRQFSSGATITFPVTVTTVFAIALTSLGAEWCWAGNISNSGFKNNNNAASTYIMAGKA